MRKIVACFLVLAFAITSGTADSLPDGDAYLEARRAELSKHYAQAITLYETCADLGGPLAHYARVASARCTHAMGDAAGAEEVYRVLIEKGPVGPWQLQARAALGMLYQEEALAPTAVELLRPIVAVSPEPWWMQPYAWRAAEHQLRTPETEALGYAYFRQAAQKNPYRKRRLEASRLLAESYATEDRTAAVLGFARGRAFPEAGATLMGIAVELLRGTEAPPDINQLLAHLLNQDADENSGASVGMNLTQLVRTFSVYQSARQKQWDTAWTTAQGLAVDYPDHEEVAEVLWWLGRTLRGNNEDALCEKVFGVLQETYPDTRYADDALYQLGLLQWHRGERDKAVAHLLSLTKTYPESAHVAHAYFLAAEFEENRNPEQSNAYREHAAAAGLGRYYAHRAQSYRDARDGKQGGIQLSTSADSGSLGYIPSVGIASVESERDFDNDTRLARLRFLGAHGLEAGHWEALALCQSLATDTAPSAYYTEIAEAGFAHMAMQWARSMSGAESYTPPNRLLYPRVYWPLVQEVAAETGLDPYLLLAVAKQESTFRARIQSTAGATGVMQLMPATAQWLGEVESGIKTEVASDLYSARNSLRLGAYYLQRLLKNTKHDDLIATLASYNGGPGNVRKWKKRFPNLAGDEFIEAIPFSETRNYVKRVLGFYAAYRSLYTSDRTRHEE